MTKRHTFFDEQVAAIRAKQPVVLFADEWRTPLSFRTAASALVALATSPVTGLIHLGGPERLSRLEMGHRLAASLAADPSLLRATARNSMAGAEARPRDTALDSTRWRRAFPDHPWPCWHEALAEMCVG